MKNCPVCEKGKLVEVDDITSNLDGYIFVVKGERCTHCREEYINEKELQPMISVAQKLGVWGQPLKLHRKLSRSARGTVLRIPTDIEKDLHLKGNEQVTIAKQGNNRIVIEIE